MRGAVLALVVWLCTLGPARLGAQPEEEACLAAARARASEALEQGASREWVRTELEIAAASCLEPGLAPAAAHLRGVVNADRARLARDFLEGRLTLAAYRAALLDRRDKLAWLERKPRRQRALAAGDADGDLVADRRDRCRETPPSTPTDARGCPLSEEPLDPNQLGMREEEERTLRAVLAGTRELYNPSCEGAPRPRIPTPLAWGYGTQARIHANGINLAVSKVRGQPNGCEIFYEMQFHFTEPNPGDPLLPPAKTVTVVFSDSEDLLTAPETALLPLPYFEVWNLPVQVSSPARSEAFWAMILEYQVATWRVRAVNGANASSPWSPFVTQRAAPGGLDG